MRRRLLVDITRQLPQGLLSRAWGWLAVQQRPRLAAAVLRDAFVRLANIDMSEAAQPAAAYASLAEVFGRALRPDARPIDTNPLALISPVDGTVGQSGTIVDDTLMQVKGQGYRLSRLLGSVAAAAAFAGGYFWTFYLAPHDYHRIHAPWTADIRQATHIPGRLLPVFPQALTQIPALLPANERVISYLEDQHRRLAVVKIGAMLVGGIHLHYAPAWRTNQPNQQPHTWLLEPPQTYTRGALLGQFAFGSSVVLLIQAGQFEPVTWPSGTPIKMGQRLALAR